MTDNATRSSKMRSYTTKVAGEYGSPRPLDVSITALDSSGQNVFTFVMRETICTEPSRSKTSDDGIKAVVELVGSATLRQIVAETTEVVERLCIETAEELTQNNCVAAAEILSLSRQSLYVKLRKFDLLARDTDD
jgi:DNA-binding NtrC family response regulator